MVIGILLAGVVTGLAVDAIMPAWMTLESPEEVQDDFAGDPDLTGLEYRRSLAERGEWWELFLAIPASIVRGWGAWGVTLLGLLTGACWFLFLFQSIQVRGWGDYRRWGLPAAVALGVLSVWPTLFLIYWQEQAWGLEESVEVAAGIRENILGVGLREEFSKFVCFLPLLPLVVWKRDELAALLFAGGVGLGFGIEENIGYIGGSIATATLGRMLVTAPFHMAMTALVGVAAYRACVWPRQCIPAFVATFVVVFIGHGLYDAVIIVPALQDYAIVSMVIFVAVIYQFFRELRPLQSEQQARHAISLTATFLFCVSTVAAATFVYLCAAVGWQLAGDVLVGGLSAYGVTVYLFLREMPETMVTV
jgi:RsiW-degrading membrane proteinase PrsW (M82 family)